MREGSCSDKDLTLNLNSLLNDGSADKEAEILKILANLSSQLASLETREAEVLKIMQVLSERLKGLKSNEDLSSIGNLINQPSADKSGAKEDEENQEKFIQATNTESKKNKMHNSWAISSFEDSDFDKYVRSLSRQK